MRSVSIALATPALTATTPRAQTAPPRRPEANVVEALRGQRQVAGSRLVAISDGDTTIYMLGVLQALPRGQAWDTGVLDRRLQAPSP